MKDLLIHIKRFINFFHALRFFLFFIIKDLKKIKEANQLFVFPVYHTGGAERVHLNIVKSSSQKKIVIFTENSATKNFLHAFKNHSEVIEINTILTKKIKWINGMLIRILVKKINKSKSIESIFGSNTYCYYEILPKIKPSITRIDLFHAFDLPDHRENNIINTIKSIDYRVVINSRAKQDIESIYLKNNVDKAYYEKLKVIGNGIKFFTTNFFVRNSKTIRIGFVGRWSHEKRPEIFVAVSKKIKSSYPNVEFFMAGTGMKSNLKIINEAGISFLGEITEEKKMAQFYENLNLILVTSSREGFPMVIMEAMACGVIPITTDVGGISEHITNNQNGILIRGNSNEEIVNAFLKILEELLNDSGRMNILSKNAFDYAHLNFGLDVFQSSYNKLLLKN